LRISPIADPKGLSRGGYLGVSTRVKGPNYGVLTKKGLL
jgi:hypothetical protein